MKHQTHTQNQRSYFKAQTSLEHLVDVTTRPRPSCVAQHVSIQAIAQCQGWQAVRTNWEIYGGLQSPLFHMLAHISLLPNRNTSKSWFHWCPKRKIFAFEGQITILRKACLISDDSIDMKLHLALHHSNERKQELIPGFLDSTRQVFNFWQTCIPGAHPGRWLRKKWWQFSCAPFWSWKKNRFFLFFRRSFRIATFFSSTTCTKEWSMTKPSDFSCRLATFSLASGPSNLREP